LQGRDGWRTSHNWAGDGSGGEEKGEECAEHGACLRVGLKGWYGRTSCLLRMVIVVLLLLLFAVVM
jgi:hypothetical protein